MKQTPAAARERREDAIHRLPETIDQFQATFAELREIIAQQAAAIEELTEWYKGESVNTNGAESMFIFTMHDDERREALRLLRETYRSAIKIRSESTRRSAEVMMYALTEPLNDHVEFFGPEDDWEHPCLCYDCRTCG